MTNEYIFTNERGWLIHEYRPFCLSYAVRQTPCLIRYPERPFSRMDYPEIRGHTVSELQADGKPEDLLDSLTHRQLKFDYLSWDVFRQMVEERVKIRDKNRKDILGSVTDVSGDIYGCYLMKIPESLRRKATLEKTKLDLERQAREEDISLWKDVTDLRKELIISNRQYESTRMRTNLFTGQDLHNGDKEKRYPVGAGYLPGA